MTDRRLRYGLVAGLLLGAGLTVTGGATGEEASGEAPPPPGAAERAEPRAAPAAGEAGEGALPPSSLGSGAPVSRTTLPDGRELRAPTAEELRALEILQEEYERYARRSRGFAATVDTIVRREYRSGWSL